MRPSFETPGMNHRRFAPAPPRLGYAAKLAAAAGEADRPRRCTEVTKKGDPCKGNPIPETGMCVGHSRKAGLL